MRWRWVPNSESSVSVRISLSMRSRASYGGIGLASWEKTRGGRLLRCTPWNTFLKRRSPAVLKRLFLEFVKGEAIKYAYGQEMNRGSCSSERPSEIQPPSNSQFNSEEVSEYQQDMIRPDCSSEIYPTEKLSIALKEAVADQMREVRKFQDEERRLRGWLIPYQPQELIKVEELIKEEETAELTESAKEEMDQEERLFEEYRRDWEWQATALRALGSFKDRTTLCPMQFTHFTDKQIRGLTGATGSVLQIYSIKIAAIKCESLNWPLHVYGEVTGRDRVDRNRNILFSRYRSNCQELTIDARSFSAPDWPISGNCDGQSGVL
ncbi:uncharacterized protein LOC112269430 [Brachypodium distachyon]|uniref:DUF6598 domain-containing protein n=1 Tax=Brachypodium distachyon TaxID=15368 RepID=A0A2K2CJE1_BRADI|nr:uncharacterized protein LOC112269430 [Brachypodium distachyon]PNT62152.1 hypothetical protein BRADI_5g26332v3 [Brachypodium distachyon]|eukprot:XP_024311925.1 uncharacterized protein LOC112269430 [Brachypodium distachyon]